MAEQKQFRRGTTAESNAFTGAEGELTVDTTKDTLIVHDGIKAGGHVLAREDLTNAAAFAGATGSVAGKKGAVPAPSAGDQAKYLKADGTWATVDAAPTDAQVETAYNARVAKVSSQEITDGTGTAVRRYSPADIVAFVEAFTETGTPGADGKSAYEVAVANGFVGDVSAWLASLVGATGPQGDDGAAGATGPAGPGLAVGGTTGQFAVKKSNTDYDTQWVDFPDIRNSIGTTWYVDAVNGNDTFNGSFGKPVKTVTRALALAGESDYIKIAPGRYTEDLTFDKEVLIEGVGAEDATNVLLNGSHSFIDGPERVKIKNVQMYATTAGTPTLTFNGTQGKIYLDNVSLYHTNGGAEVVANFIGNNLNWVTMVDCQIDGKVNLKDASQTSTFTVYFTRGAGNTQIDLQRPNVSVVAKGRNALGATNHTTGSLFLVDISTVVSLTSTAATGFLGLINTSFLQQNGSFGTLVKSGAAPFVVSGSFYNPSVTLTGTEIVGSNARHISANHTPVNYTAAKATLDAHIAGIDVALANAGQPGAQGPAGEDGTDGVDGKSAYQVALDNGFEGTEAAWLLSLRGDTGAQGPKGDTGSQGPAGADGATGVQGPKGDTGDAGAPGADGAQGPKGDTGDTGPTGPAGADGAQGPKGDTGAAGAKGDTGDTGPAGAQGEDGESAYEVAEANGFVGTVGEWLASLVGPQGPAGTNGTNGADGATGPAGADGAQGPKGDTGDTGLQGPAGAKGDTGEAGLSVTTAAVVADDLIITLSDDSEINAGNVRGPKGDTGNTGATGADGAAGAQGPKGDTGDAGATGATGPGYTSATVDGTGHLILTKTDTTTVDVGLVKGADGAQGPKGDTGNTGTAGSTGATGPGFTTATVDGSGHLIITKTDTTTVDAGLVKGANGANGQGVPTGGTAGQVLKKNSTTDFDTVWGTDNGLTTVTTSQSATITFTGSGTSGSALTAAVRLSATAGNELTANGDGIYFASSKIVPIVTDATTAKTFALTDSASYVRMTNASAKAVTVPTNATVAYPLGTVLSVVNAGAGTLTITPASGVTINKLSAQTYTLAQFATAALTKVGTDEWDLTGSMTAS